MLSWELTSKHRGDICTTPVPLSPREHCVSLSKKRSQEIFFLIQFVEKVGKKASNV